MGHDLVPVSGKVELQRAADKARELKSERARRERRGRKKIKHGKPRKRVKHGKHGKPRRPTVVDELVLTSCSSEIKPVWIAACAFFFAGAIDDAMYYSHSRKKSAGWFPQRRRAFLHAILAHAYCAAGCYYVERRCAATDAATRGMLKVPLVILCGWMWKSAVVRAAETIIEDAVDTTWAACLIWFGAALLLSVAAVYYAAWCRRRPPPAATDGPVLGALGAIALALSADAAVLPIAALWDEALVYHTSSLTPEGAYRAISPHRVHLVKALVVHLLVCTTLQCWRNYARRTTVHASPGDEALAANRAVFEDRTFFFVVAWGWWNVPELLSEASGLKRGERCEVLAAITVFYACLAVLKTWARVPAAGAAVRADAVFLSLAAASVDPQLGWAIKATYGGPAFVSSFL